MALIQELISPVAIADLGMAQTIFALDPKVQLAIAVDPACSPDVRDAIYGSLTQERTGHSEEWVKIWTAIARDPLCQPADLDRLATFDIYLIWKILAANPACWDSTIDALVTRAYQHRRADGRDDAFDREALLDVIANRPQLLPATLLRIVYAQISHLNDRIARRLDCPAEVLTFLSRYGVASVQRATVSNPACPSETLAEMRAVQDAELQTLIEAHPNYPAHLRAIRALGAPIVGSAGV